MPFYKSRSMFGQTSINVEEIVSAKLICQSDIDENLVIRKANGTKIISTDPATNSLVIHNDLNVTGDMLVGGSVTTVSSENLSLSDNFIELSSGNLSDLVDSGLLFQYNSTSARSLFYDNSATTFKLFTGIDITTPPTTTISTGSLANLTVADLTATNVSGNGSGLTSLNASNISSGTVAIARGGTNTSSVPTNGQLLIGNGTDYTLANITGTSNQISVTNGSGSITLSTPQNINSGAAPTFLGTNFTELNASNISSGTLAVNRGGTGQTTYTNGQLLIGNTTGNTLTKANLTGTSNQITVTNGTGSITLSTPQDINTTSSPQFCDGSGNKTFIIGSSSDAGTDIKSLSVRSNGFANVSIQGDYSNTSGEPGGAYLYISVDGGGSYNMIGISNTSEFAPDGTVLAGVVANHMTYLSQNDMHFFPDATKTLTLSGTAVTPLVPILLPAGTISAPSFAFSTNTDMGLYQPTTSQMRFSVNSADVFEINANYIHSMEPHIFYDGTALAPSITFQLATVNDLNTGFYQSALDNIDITTGGVNRFNINSTALTTTVPVRVSDGSAVAPSLSFSGDTDTGFYSSAANEISLSTIGTKRLSINQTDILPGQNGVMILGNTSFQFSGIYLSNSPYINNDQCVSFIGLFTLTNVTTGYQTAKFACDSIGTINNLAVQRNTFIKRVVVCSVSGNGTTTYTVRINGTSATTGNLTANNSVALNLSVYVASGSTIAVEALNASGTTNDIAIQVFGNYS